MRPESIASSMHASAHPRHSLITSLRAVTGCHPLCMGAGATMGGCAALSSPPGRRAPGDCAHCTSQRSPAPCLLCCFAIRAPRPPSQDLSRSLQRTSTRSGGGPCHGPHATSRVRQDLTGCCSGPAPAQAAALAQPRGSSQGLTGRCSGPGPARAPSSQDRVFPGPHRSL